MRRLSLLTFLCWALFPSPGQRAPGAEADKADDRPVAGVFRSADGQPVVDANVWLVTASMRGEPEALDHARTDAKGRFQLTLPGRWRQQHVTYRQELGVVGYQPEVGLGSIGYGRYSIPAESGLVLQAKSPREAKLRILAPDGRPVAGARLIPMAVVCDSIRTDLADAADWQLSADMKADMKQTVNGPALYQTSITLPPELSRQFTAETDGDGRATISGLALEEISVLRVGTNDYGMQVALMAVPTNGKFGAAIPEAIELRPVGGVSGRIVAPAEADKQISSVVIHTFPPADPKATPSFSIHGRAEVAPDAQGRFEIPAIAAGTLSFMVTPVEDSPFRAQAREGKPQQAAAGERTEIEIPLVRGIPARGVVRERGSQRPVGGVRVMLAGENFEPSSITDDEGRFTCLIPPGQVLAAPSVPARYAPITQEQMSRLLVNVPDDATEFEFPPIELSPLAPAHGVVVDEDGKPAAGAKVRARWYALNQATGQPSMKDVTLGADEQGEFALEGVDPDKELIVEARSRDGFGRVRLMVKDTKKDRIEVTLRSEDLISLAGKATDTSGRALADAAIEIWMMPQTFEGLVSMEERVKFDGGAEIRTDEEGDFETPRELDRQSVYQARIALPGREPAASQWAWANETSLHNLVVRRLTTLAGRVVDRQGRPVAEATVFQSGDLPRRVQTTTDAEGRFRLEGVPADPAFVFVSKPSFRFYGQMVRDQENSLELTLTRVDESVAQGGATPSGKTLPRLLSKAERLALARRVLEPCLQEGLELKEAETIRVSEALAFVDPAVLLERLEKSPPQHPFMAGALRRVAAKSLAAEDVDEALAVVESIGDKMMRSMTYLEIADLLADDQRARKLELIRQASLIAKQIAEPPMKVFQLGQAADRLLDLGQNEAAIALLREGEQIARQLPQDAFGGYARGAFAEELAQIDLPAALELMKGLSETSEFDRHHGNAAHELAAKDPAAAERLLGMLHSGEETRRIYDSAESWGVRVCYRMAPVDLTRARRLADGFTNPYLKAQAYGAMAQAIGFEQREAAVELVQRAFDVLERLVAERERLGPGDPQTLDRDQYYYQQFSASSLAGILLPNIEAIDPALMPEYFWRAVSFRLPREGDKQALDAIDRSNLALAVTLARYDREVAAAILKPIRARQPSFTGSRDVGLAALTLVDPQGAVEAVESAPAERPDCLLRAELAQWLALEGDAFWRKVHNALALWAIDVEDLF